MNLQHALRFATADDLDAILRVHRDAFGGPAEAEAVVEVLSQGLDIVSMVATTQDSVIAHVLFTSIGIATMPIGWRGVGLAPLAVLPPWQYRGIGTHLARAGVQACADAGFDGVVVLGAPRLYRRAGFLPARHFGLSSIWPGTSEAFQARELRVGGFAGCAGLVTYVNAFQKL